MKIIYYCQHVLGLGHFHRSLEICRACSAHHEVTMIVGGPQIELRDERFSFLQLPGLKMDEEFSGLQTCDPSLSVEEVKTARQKQLLAFFTATEADCLIIELYPFGRKAFSFELKPLLETARQAGCKIYCSLRDILVEKKTGREKHERRALEVLNMYFDGLLIHADPKVVTLEETFGLTDQIQVPLHYTGFVTPRPAAAARTKTRSALGLDHDQKLIVVSIGSGSVGSYLLEAVAETVDAVAAAESGRFHFFTGPYCGEHEQRRLAEHHHPALVVDRFAENFIDLLAAADLSISMAGYNTSMNILAAGVPALMLPFAQNREQRLRVEQLTADHPIRLLHMEDLSPERLIPIIRSQLRSPRYQTAIDLNGAGQTLNIIETG